MPADRAPLGFGRQVGTVLLMQLANWRWSWRQMVLTGMLAPLITMAMLGAFARPAGPAAGAQVLAGSLTMALLFQMQNKIANSFAFMRHTGAFDFYAALPIGREALVLATLLAFTLLALPALVVTVLAGVVLLHLSLHVSPVLVPAVLVSLLPSAGIGAWIGARSSSLEQASSTSLACTLAMVSIGPVTVPASLLPEALVQLGRLNPGVYAASALRRSLTGGADVSVLSDLSVLVALSVVVWVGLRLRMPWRPRPTRARPTPYDREGDDHDGTGVRRGAVAHRRGVLG